MQGMAQRLFIERHGKQPWGSFSLQERSPWPLLECILEAGCLSYVDFALAQRILTVLKLDDEACAALICHLSVASRQGHLCVSIDDIIDPDPKEIWQQTDKNLIDSISEENWDLVRSLIKAGAKTFEVNRLPICRHGTKYYLQRYWSLETEVIQHLAPLLSEEKPQFSLDLIQAKTKVDELLKANKLLPEQADAILRGCENALTVIIGGPGTGKTYTAGIFLRTFWECLPAEERSKCRIRLAAPTGKAAANLEASMRRAFEGLSEKPNICAQTLHMLLNVRQNVYSGEVAKLDADLVLVDESSMIDVNLMRQLLAAHKPGARLVLLGDRYQLPPVEAGSLFADLVRYFSASGSLKHFVELSRCMRAELKSIVDLSQHVNEGDDAKVLEVLQEGKHEGVSFQILEEKSNPLSIRKQLLAYALTKFPVIDRMPKQPQHMLSHFAHFKILTPLRQGMLGMQELNALFFDAISARSSNKEWFGVPIMIVRNHYRMGLFNGESGVLIKHNIQPSKDYALFPSRGEEEVRRIPALLLPEHEYAFCASIHKSQGSEYEHVLMLLPEGSEVFGREALYTGITRARRSIEIWSTPTILKAMIERQSIRHSGIIERLVT